MPQIKAPTLVITGAKDVLIPAKNSELIASRIPGAKLHLIADAGHGFMTEDRDEFVRVFVPFAKSHPMAERRRVVCAAAIGLISKRGVVSGIRAKFASRSARPAAVCRWRNWSANSSRALDIDEAEIAARFMVGRALAQGEEKRLQISGRAIWKIVAAMTGTEDQGEDIYTAAEDFGDAIGMMLKLRASEPEPTLTIREVAPKFAEIADIEGRHSRGRKLGELRALFERATALEGKYLTKILIREMRHGMSEGIMLEAIAKMGARPVAEVRRDAHAGRRSRPRRANDRARRARKNPSRAMRRPIERPRDQAAQADARVTGRRNRRRVLDARPRVRARAQARRRAGADTSCGRKRRHADFLAPAQRDHPEPA